MLRQVKTYPTPDLGTRNQPLRILSKAAFCFRQFGRAAHAQRGNVFGLLGMNQRRLKAEDWRIATNTPWQAEVRPDDRLGDFDFAYGFEFRPDLSKRGLQLKKLLKRQPQ